MPLRSGRQTHPRFAPCVNPLVVVPVHRVCRKYGIHSNIAHAVSALLMHSIADIGIVQRHSFRMVTKSLLPLMHRSLSKAGVAQNQLVPVSQVSLRGSSQVRLYGHPLHSVSSTAGDEVEVLTVYLDAALLIILSTYSISQSQQSSLPKFNRRLDASFPFSS